jgi:hypothetical protein
MKVAFLAHSFPLQYVKSKMEYIKLRMIAALTCFSGICGTKFSKKCNFSKNRGLPGFRRGYRLRVRLRRQH